MQYLDYRNRFNLGRVQSIQEAERGGHQDLPSVASTCHELPVRGPPALSVRRIQYGQQTTHEVVSVTGC